jgi:hypothetical protein
MSAAAHAATTDAVRLPEHPAVVHANSSRTPNAVGECTERVG